VATDVVQIAPQVGSDAVARGTEYWGVGDVLRALGGAVGRTLGGCAIGNGPFPPGETCRDASRVDPTARVPSTTATTAAAASIGAIHRMWWRAWTAREWGGNAGRTVRSSI
jgi:hypothetical protein